MILTDTARRAVPRRQLSFLYINLKYARRVFRALQCIKLRNDSRFVSWQWQSQCSTGAAGCSHSMICARVYVTVRCPYVCLSRLAPQLRRAACLLLWMPRAGDIDRLLHGASAASAAFFWSTVWQRRMKLNADLLTVCTADVRRNRGLTTSTYVLRLHHDQMSLDTFVRQSAVIV